MLLNQFPIVGGRFLIRHNCSNAILDSANDSCCDLSTSTPTATDIVAVQVESLALESDPLPAGSGHTFRGKIRVLKHHRGSGQFVDIKYINSRCSGLRIDVGGVYLIATNSLTPTIELNSHAPPILHVSGFLPMIPTSFCDSAMS